MSIFVSVAVPLGAAAIAGASAIGGQWNGGRNEKAKWLREQRLEIYAEFLNLVHRAAIEDRPTKGSTVTTEARAALNRVQVIGPENMAKAAAKSYSAMLEAQRQSAVFLKSGGNYEDSAARRAVDDYHDAEREFAVSARQLIG